MDAQLATYSPEFQQFIQQVETALVQAAADARELAERTGTKLVTREMANPEDEGKRDARERKAAL